MKQSARFDPLRRPVGKKRITAARTALEAAIIDRTDVDLSWIYPPPVSGGWTLAPDALRFLVRLIKHLRPRHILEFGSGLSTKVLAWGTATFHCPCGISSIDHDPEFGVSAKEGDIDLQPGPRIHYQLAPIVARDCGGKWLPVYLLQAECFASCRPPDLVVIDGPPITLGGREGTLYQVLDFACPGTLVLLDDARRTSERMAVAHWQDSLGDAIEVVHLEGFTKGMAAIIVHEPIRRSELWYHKLYLTKMQIEAIVAPGEVLILIDQRYWTEELADGRSSISLVVRNGQSWGLPEDDRKAIQELQRCRQAGAGYLVFLWPAFWWLEYYSGLARYLYSHFRLIVENDCLVAFDLRHEKQPKS